MIPFRKVPVMRKGDLSDDFSLHPPYGGVGLFLFAAMNGQALADPFQSNVTRLFLRKNFTV